MSLRKFEIQEMIAKGGMAEVFLAKTVGLEGFAKQVCVKKILPHLTEDKAFVTMFIDEAKLAATLNYANIVQVHDLCVSAEHEYFIVMEYVHGKDLSDVIRAAQLAGKEIPPHIATYIARETCKGLYYAHTKTDVEGAPLNIIHRDISPQNVLCSFMGEVKITDFGIAKASSSVTKTAVGILKGKYGYMSPEQARGERIDPRSDLFNMGIVLYEMLVGERCFAGASDYSTLNLMREAKVTPPTKINKEIPKDLEAITMKALQKNPADRFEDALEFEAALSDFARSTREAHDTDLVRFMKELFREDETRKNDASTGVIQLSSVVGPAPDAPKPEKPRAPTPPAPKPEEPRAKVQSAEVQLAESEPLGAKSHEPGKKALERAKKRKATRNAKSEEVSPAAAKAKVAKIQPKPKSDAAASKPERKPERKPASAKPASKSERKPARVKPAASDKKADKKRAKEEARANRKPVGRRDLKPNLTALNRLKRPSSKNGLLKAAAILIIAGGAGWFGGKMQTHESSQQGTFRQAELGDTPAAELDKNVQILVRSQPQGAEVWLDGNKLADPTPVAVRRPRDEQEHTVKLVLGDKTKETQFTYQGGPLTILENQLTSGKGELAIYGKPSGLKARVDGKSVGTTPMSIDVAPGPHEIQIGGGDHELIERKVVVKAGEKTEVNPLIPKVGQLSSLGIESEPEAEVMIDGVRRGRTNGAPIPLEPGAEHKVSLIAPNAKREFPVRLEPGEKRRMFLDLRKRS